MNPHGRKLPLLAALVAAFFFGGRADAAMERFPGLRLMRPSWPAFDIQCSTSAVTCGGGLTIGSNPVLTGNWTFNGNVKVQDQAKFQVCNQADGTKCFEVNLTPMTTANTIVWQLGGTAVAPTLTLGPSTATPGTTFLQGISSRGGTDTNVAGGDSTFAAGAGTGNAVSSKIHFQLPLVGGAGGTTQETLQDQFVVAPSGLQTSPQTGGGTFVNSTIAIGTIGNAPSFGGANNSVGIGDGVALGTSTGNVFIGQGAGGTAGVNNCVLIGRSVSVGASAFADCLGIGRSQIPTASNQGVLGSLGGITSWFFGRGVTNATPDATLTFSGTGGNGTNILGSSIVWAPGDSTGNAAGAKVELQRNLQGASGTSAQTQQSAITACESKTLSNTTGITTALANIASPSNSSGGAFFTVSVQCNDGTNFDSDNLSCNQSWVNKAGTFTFGTLQCTTSSAAQNSGTCTTAVTVTGAGSTVSLNVTPVIATITPTTTTGYIEVHNHGGGNVTCQ